jgi:uncharacterized protein (TIGR02271 family)
MRRDSHDPRRSTTTQKMSRRARQSDDPATSDAEPVNESPFEERQILELREEELVAHKESVESGVVRVRKWTEHLPSRLEVEVSRDELEVEHVPVGRVVAERAEAREESGRWIVPVYEEQLVVVKRLILREEIHFRRIPTRE